MKLVAAGLFALLVVWAVYVGDDAREAGRRFGQSYLGLAFFAVLVVGAVAAYRWTR